MLYVWNDDFDDDYINMYKASEILERSEFFIIVGLEEFEEKVDKIADGKISGDDWISKIYNQFSFFNDVDNQLTETDLDGIEPPILDETWGLGVRNSSKVDGK